MVENQIYKNIYQSLKNFGISSKTADSIASYSSINDFYKKNIHIAYTVINNKEIWSMNQKKMKILNSRKCSEHAEERLIKKINRCFYRKKNINNISVYSLRINQQGEIKCAKPCKECVKYLINSKIKDMMYILALQVGLRLTEEIQFLGIKNLFTIFGMLRILVFY